MLWSYLLWIGVGSAIGAIARMLYPGPQNLSLFAAMVIGMFGGLAGGILSWVMVDAPQGPFQGTGWALATIGALLFVWLALVNSRRKLSNPMQRRQKS